MTGGPFDGTADPPIWIVCLDQRRDHAVTRQGPVGAGGFLRAVCGTPVYPLAAGPRPGRRCRHCLASLATAPAPRPPA